MTSIPVNSAKNTLVNFAAKTPEKVQGAGAAGSFTDVLSRQTEGNTASRKTENVKAEAGTQTKVTKSAAERMKQKNVTEADKADGTKNAEEIAGALQEAGAKTVKEIAEELGVSEEEVVRAMEALGLTAIDLLQPENLTMVVMQTVGETDPMALLTNDQLSAALKNLNQFVQDVRNELQTAFEIPEEQLDGLLDQVRTVEAMNAEEVPADAAEEAKTPRILVETVSEEGKELQTQTGNRNVDAPAEGTNVELSTQPVEKTGLEERGKEAGHEAGDRNPAGQNLFLQNLTQNAEAATAAETTESPFAQTQTREIMDQILNFMRIQIKPEMTQLEMQLHPESLGTVNVHIASREGVITAQFTAQNETVKAALESQMIQLKETFAEQGVKVEAIEVSVQANGFRQEYEGSREHGSSADDRERKPARRINLNNPAFLEKESLSEEEELAVSMMEVNGNTVDYTA